MKTAWHLTHRIRKAMEAAPTGPMGNEGETIEADVTYVGRKEGTKVRRGAGHMRAVFTLVQRDGTARSIHIPNVRASSLGSVLDAMRRARRTCGPTRRGYSRSLAITSPATRPSTTLRTSSRGATCIPTPWKASSSILKRGVYGTYQNVSEEHLSRYLAEFDFRYSTRAKLGVDDATRTGLAVKGGKGKRLTYETFAR